MSEKPGDPNCICQGTGLATRLTATGNTGPEVCECVARTARQEERERVGEVVRPILNALAGLNTESLLSLGLRGRQIAAALNTLKEETPDA